MTKESSRLGRRASGRAGGNLQQITELARLTRNRNHRADMFVLPIYTFSFFLFLFNLALLIDSIYSERILVSFSSLFREIGERKGSPDPAWSVFHRFVQTPKPTRLFAIVECVDHLRASMISFVARCFSSSTRAVDFLRLWRVQKWTWHRVEAPPRQGSTICIPRLPMPGTAYRVTKR